MALGLRSKLIYSRKTSIATRVSSSAVRLDIFSFESTIVSVTRVSHYFTRTSLFSPRRKALQ